MRRSRSRAGPGSPGESVDELAEAYLQALEKCDDDAALEVLRRSLVAGLDGPAIYLGVFQPAMDRVVVCWEQGTLRVGVEHRAIAMTRWLMDALVDDFKPTQRRRGVAPLLAGCVRDERHDLGLTMVVRFLRRDGRQVVDLGADVPEPEFAEMATRVNPSLLLLSAAQPARLGAARATIEAVRGAGLSAPILIGGVVFRHEPALATMAGATATAPDAAQAVACVRQLLHA
mgnify:CR=1 FL=1